MNRIKIPPLIKKDNQEGKEAIKKKEIKDFNSCPHCGSEFGYYQKFVTEGICHDNTLFNGEKYNTEMWDSLTDLWNSKYYYCMECNKAICKVTVEQ